MIIDKINNIPHKSGIYIWKDKNNNVLYVGKAHDLQKRMKQYFHKMTNSIKTHKMVEKIANYEIFITNNDKEALILERNLIQKFLPEYNIKLIDHKKYPYIYIKLLKHDLIIKILFSKNHQTSKNEFYFGPLPPTFGVKHLFNLVNRMYKYENGILIKTNSKSFWSKKYLEIKKFLFSDFVKMIKYLKKQMLHFAKLMQYEIANDIKQTMQTLQNLKNKQVINVKETRNFDVITFIEKDNFLSIFFTFYRFGMLFSKKHFLIEIAIDKISTIRQFMTNYYLNHPKPHFVIADHLFETTIEVIIPHKGIKKNILKLNYQNNHHLLLKEFTKIMLKSKQRIIKMQKLSEIINIKNINHIVMIDNSHTSDDYPISALISYKNGQKDFSNYRKYAINDEKKGDTFYLKTGLIKYFCNEKMPYPDLLIVDGGKLQVNEAKKILQNFSNIIGLVKNKNHQTNHIIDVNFQKININNQIVFNFLSQMQKEVDIFAKNQHRRKRLNSLYSSLISIKGIGYKIEQKLLNHFKSYTNIYNASIDDLSKVVSFEIAKKIKKKLK